MQMAFFRKVVSVFYSVKGFLIFFFMVGRFRVLYRTIHMNADRREEIPKANTTFCLTF